MEQSIACFISFKHFKNSGYYIHLIQIQKQNFSESKLLAQGCEAVAVESVNALKSTDAIDRFA
jgi:hypothetical protein